MHDGLGYATWSQSLVCCFCAVPADFFLVPAAPTEHQLSRCPDAYQCSGTQPRGTQSHSSMCSEVCEQPELNNNNNTIFDQEHDFLQPIWSYTHFQVSATRQATFQLLARN